MAAPIILASNQQRAVRNANVTLNPNEFVTPHPTTAQEAFYSIFGNELDSLVAGGPHPEVVGSLQMLQSKAVDVIQPARIQTGPAAEAVAARGRQLLSRLGFRAQ